MRLYELPSIQKSLIKMVLITLTFGIILGLIYVSVNTSIKPNSIASYYQGSEVVDEFELSYGKSFKELLQTTHNHIIAFTFIFTIMGFMMSMTHYSEKIKKFIIIEPFISTIITFSCMFLIRYVSDLFVYLMIISSMLMYLTYFISVFLVYNSLRK